MAANNVPNVWSTMDYMPPRGQCNYKQSIVSGKCPCLRFMLHPLKSSSSYECDGCTHHASFHSMENKEEDEIRKRWEQDARKKGNLGQSIAALPKKRLREIEYNAGDVGGLGVRATAGIFDTVEVDEAGSASGSGTGRGKAPARGRGKKSGGGVGRATGTRARGKVVEVEQDEDEEFIELD